MRDVNEFYRFITSGLVHADIMHLAFNMFTLYFFGPYAERFYTVLFGDPNHIKFIILYVGGLICSSIYSYFKHKDNPSYMALGASGAVSGVLFATILLDPWNWLLIFGIIPVPAILFGVAYLIYSAKMAKEGKDNIGHDAHFYGAIFGLVITLAFGPMRVLELFITNLLNPTWPF